MFGSLCSSIYVHFMTYCVILRSFADNKKFYGLLVYISMWFSRQVTNLHRNLLHPFSAPKMEAAGFFKILLCFYQTV